MLSFALEERDFIYAMLAVRYLRHPQNRSGFLHFHNEEIKYESYFKWEKGHMNPFSISIVLSYMYEFNISCVQMTKDGIEN
jgi:hypothetical protein